MNACTTVEEYVKGLPAVRRAELLSAWRAIRATVPGGEEAIRYGIPTIRFRGRNLVHFAVMKDHYGFYPTSSGVRAAEDALKGKYSYSTGTIRFPLDAPVPLPLIRKIVRFRFAEERARE